MRIAEQLCQLAAVLQLVAEHEYVLSPDGELCEICQAHAVEAREPVVLVLRVRGELRGEPHLVLDGLAPYAVAHGRKVQVVVGVGTGHVVGARLYELRVQVDVFNAVFLAQTLIELVCALDVICRAQSAGARKYALHVHFCLGELVPYALQYLAHTFRGVLGEVDAVGAEVVGAYHDEHLLRAPYDVRFQVVQHFIGVCAGYASVQHGSAAKAFAPFEHVRDTVAYEHDAVFLGHECGEMVGAMLTERLVGVHGCRREQQKERDE